MPKLRVIICPVGRPPYVTNISGRIENLQTLVGGYIEAVRLDGFKSVILCDEEARLKEREINPSSFYGFPIYGDFLIVGTDGEEFGDVPVEEKDNLYSVFRSNWNRNHPGKVVARA